MSNKPKATDKTNDILIFGICAITFLFGCMVGYSVGTASGNNKEAEITTTVSETTETEFVPPSGNISVIQ